jgi:hypothetical protein
MSRRPLTGYDNRDAVTGVRDEEVYLYGANGGRLTCVSCNPTGARPKGVVRTGSIGNGQVNLPLAGGSAEGFDSKTVFAAILPSWNRYRLDAAEYQPRYLSDSGRLFFNSMDGLVAKDSNGVGDVYQFEPEGTGSCAPGATDGSVILRPARPFEIEGQTGEELAGCVGLISSGTSGEESAFLDASESGDDVFFLSTAKLSPADVEGGRTVYDAHVCSAASPCPPPPPPAAPTCSGDACQQPATAPSDATPGSLTFRGAGNVRECPKGKLLRGAKCVSAKGKKHHRKRHHRKGRGAAQKGVRR